MIFQPISTTLDSVFSKKETYMNMDLQQRSGQPSVSLGVEEAGGHPEVPHLSGPPDPVDVLVDGLGQVVVDDVLTSRRSDWSSG